MHGTYLQNKQSLYNWVEKNRDRHNEYVRNWKRWKKVKHEFLMILIDI